MISALINLPAKNSINYLNLKSKGAKLQNIENWAELPKKGEIR